MMTQLCIWKIFLFSLWIHFDLLPVLHCNVENEQNLSKQDFMLIQDEENPKCFTRTKTDFTCFFETTDNGTYDFLYKNKGHPSKKCKMSIHGTENGTVLHVCSFPRFDIFLYAGTEVKVVDQTKNITLYERTVYVEELCLLDPPSIVSLQPEDTVGKMLLSLGRNLKHLWKKSKYRIRYSSKTLGEKTVEVKDDSFLLSLEPGEEVEVQASVKCANRPDEHPGYWSAWSKPVRAIVPQSADDISLICFTSDLQHVTCHWNNTKYAAENDYKLFYNSRQSLNWTECQDDGNLSDTCSFRGDESGAMKIKLSSTAAPLKRLFFSKEIELKKSIKSGPPSHLKGKLINDKLCLEWEAPLPSLSNHMKYEVNVQIKGVEEYTMTKPGDTSMCVSLSSGSQFSVRVRAQPDGSIYSGYWSDWSDVLSGTNSDISDFMLIQDEENPKCFTRTKTDFTCFFETTDNGTYDFLYKNKGHPSKKCKTSIHGTENGTFLHVCSFPRFDIFLYAGTEVKVVDQTKNITLYERTVYVEELCLLDPPSIVSLQPEDTVGKMLVSLGRNLKHLWMKSKYRIHYSSKTLGEKTVEVKDDSFLLSLEPGEEVEVQASVKCANRPDEHPGYWSAWSKPVRAIVPQSADRKLLWRLCGSMLIIIIFFIPTVLLCRRKLKLLFWPPVPNLEKVLQGFLTDINQQKWNPPVTSKLCFEETTSSVVEIMSDELPVLDNPSEELNFLSSDGSFSFEEQADGSSGSETLRDYVTLNKDLSVLCLKQNCYVYEQFKDGKDPEKGDNLSTTCHCLKPCSCSNYFNHSYLPLSQSTDGLNKNINVGHDKSNPYTNLFLD